MNLLIPYVNIINHQDPLLKEFTYGDVGQRGRTLKSLSQGDYIFFHTTINGKKFITAYYIVERTIQTKEAIKDKRILAKYKNPHLLEALKEDISDYDVIVFGDPILSKALERVLPFNKDLAKKLSLNIKFSPDKTETQIIGSATRNWRKLTDNDVEVLLKEIDIIEKEGFDFEKILSTEEIVELLERDIESYLVKNHKLLGEKIIDIIRQLDTPVGRIDLFLEEENSVTIVEIKLSKIGNEAVSQTRRYIDWARKQLNKEIKGIIVCSGVMPAFEEDLAKLKNIKIFCYGWQMKIIPWQPNFI